MVVEECSRHLEEVLLPVVVSMLDAWNFCYVLPSLEPITNIDDTEIIIPHALQMGWAESLPFFCAATETARDIV